MASKEKKAGKDGRGVSRRNKGGKGKAALVDAFKEALKVLGLRPEDVFAHREYSSRIVIVTRGGKKHSWRI